MTEYANASRQLADRLPPGDHRLDNAALREAFGVSRITTPARHEIAAELQRAGLEVLYDPSYEPLVVRKTAHQPLRAPRAPRRGWRARPVIVAVAAVLFLLFVVAAAVGPDSEDEKTDASPPVQESTAAQTTETPPPQTRADAIAEVEDENYAEALVIAAALGEDEESYIARRISRHIARRALAALRTGDRAEARALLREAKQYPSTSATRTARTRLAAAEREADARRLARQQAREERRQARAAAKAEARAEARARRRADEAATPDPAESGESAPDTSGPSTNNWCGKRDGDGDGIYCEGE